MKWLHLACIEMACLQTYLITVSHACNVRTLALTVGLLYLSIQTRASQILSVSTYRNERQSLVGLLPGSCYYVTSPHHYTYTRKATSEVLMSLLYVWSS